jgi:hypothetical protein
MNSRRAVHSPHVLPCLHPSLLDAEFFAGGRVPFRTKK